MKTLRCWNVFLFSIQYYYFVQVRKHLTTNSKCDMFDHWNEEGGDDEEHTETNIEEENGKTKEYEDDTDDDDSDDNNDDNNGANSQSNLVDFENEEEVVRVIGEHRSSHDSVNTAWKGFKLVGDNIHINVRRSFQRSYCTTRSLHYFHSYAILDRVDLSGVCDDPSNKPLLFESLLPSASDISDFKKALATLVTRLVY